MDATISVVCYKSKTLSNGEHPLMLRISKDGKKKYQSLGISVNPKFWDFQKNKPKPKCPNLEYLQKIILDKKLELQKKMLEIKSDQKEYSAATLIEANEKLQVAQKTRQQNRRRKHNGVTDSFTETKVLCSPFLSYTGLAE